MEIKEADQKKILEYYQMLVDREQREYALYLWQVMAGADAVTCKRYEKAWQREEEKARSGLSSGDYSSPIFSAARKALCGMLTLPISFIFFLPFFCLSSSLRLRLMSPP